MKADLVVKYIVNWLNTYCEKSQQKGFVIGVSGGIDSALTSTLCALTGKEVVCLNLPIHQSKTEYSRSQEHINWLMKKFDTVSHFEINLSAPFVELEKNISSSNTRSFNIGKYAQSFTHAYFICRCRKQKITGCRYRK